jgi:la-related protein 1
VSSATSNDLTPSTVVTPSIAVNGTSSAISGAASNEVLSSTPVSQSDESSDTYSKLASFSPQGQLPTQALNPISTPSSPDFGTASTSTLQKEDDVSSTPNTSSESTWDKQSQTSTNADKATEQAEKDKDKGKEKEKDAPKTLMAAPIPTVNFWEQRMEAQAAKAKLNPQTSASTQQASLKTSALSPVSNGHGSGPVFQAGKAGNDRTPDQGKLDVKKKGKYAVERVDDDDKTALSQSGDKKDNMSLSRDKKKSFDGHGKPREDLARKIGPRVKASADKGKELSSIPVPPPVEDPISWPTPDTAQDEKKRAQEKVEKSDKEKAPATGTRPHGKEKWMPVPYTPSVVYQTPLPGLRGRGVRSTRGGRAGASMGNGVGNGADKGTSLQSLSIATTDMSERGRDESTTRQDSASLPFKPSKRPASIGPSGSNSQRKPGHSSISDKNRQTDAGNSVETEVAPPSAPISRRTSTATQTDHTHRFRQDYRQGHRADTSMFNGHAHATIERNERGHSHNNESHTHPRSAGPDRRAEAFGRNSDYFRDTGNYQTTRERSESGPERSRGGYRGSRGSSNGYTNGQHSNHGYSNGHHPHQQSSSSYPYSKSPSPYQGSQPQIQQSGQYNHSQQHSRTYRSGPRSQSVPNPIVYNGYGQGMAGGPQQLPALQTSISNPYDYPGMPLSAMPYSPFLQQYSDFRALVEQL